MGFYRTLAKAIPKNLKKKLENLVLATNITMQADIVLGFIILFVLGLSLAMAFFISALLKWNFMLTFLATAVVLYSTIYLLALVSADKKTKFIEELLPDALQLMASNLRAGIGIEKSLLLAARPEFGPLEKEIHTVGKEVATGKDVGNALFDMSVRIRSKPLERVVKLIIAGLRSGGKLATLLENSAEDLRVQKLVKEKIKSNVEIYTIFIFVSAGIGSPMLFALSLFLVKIIIANFANIDIPASAAGTIPIILKEVNISPTFLLKYILISLVSTSILSSFTLGLISRGRTKEGAKYIILLISLSLGLFFAIGYILSSVFGGLFFS